MYYKEGTQQEKYDEYKEAMISIRHYSNLRFAILTVFSSLMLLLFKFIFNLNLNDTNVSDISITSIKFFICLFGFGLTTIFLYLERVLNSYMVSYEKFATKLREISHLNYRHQKRAPEALIVLYSIVNFLWLYLFLSSFSNFLIDEVQHLIDRACLYLFFCTPPKWELLLTIPSVIIFKIFISFLVTFITAFRLQKVKA
jgi:hypothetical protein